jgi:mRNA interferase RelE/StbE
MGSYRIFIKPSAAKELEAIGTRKDRRRIVTKIRSLAGDPRPPGCRKLSGYEKYRIRVGSWRIIYSIEDGRLIVTVVRIAHRREAYRRLR